MHTILRARTYSVHLAVSRAISRRPSALPSDQAFACSADKQSNMRQLLIGLLFVALILAPLLVVLWIDRRYPKDRRGKRR